VILKIKNFNKQSSLLKKKQEKILVVSKQLASEPTCHVSFDFLFSPSTKKKHLKNQIKTYEKKQGVKLGFLKTYRTTGRNTSNGQIENKAIACRPRHISRRTFSAFARCQKPMGATRSVSWPFSN
jgi:hypothetical protein